MAARLFQSISSGRYLYCGFCSCCGAPSCCCCCCPAACACCCPCTGGCTSYCATSGSPTLAGWVVRCWKSAATRCTSSSGTRKKWKRVGSFNWFQRLEKKFENISPWRSTRRRSLLSSKGFLVCNSPSFTPLTAWSVPFSSMTSRMSINCWLLSGCSSIIQTFLNGEYYWFFHETGRKYIGETVVNGQVTGRLSVVVVPFVGLSWALLVKNAKKPFHSRIFSPVERR